MIWMPAMPVVWIGLLVVIGAALCAMLRRGPVIANALRACSLVLLGVVVASPSIEEDRPATEALPRLTLFVDGSASMRAGSQERDTSYDGVGTSWLSDEALARLSEVARVRVVDLDGQPWAPDRAGTGRVSSPVIAGIESILASETPPDHLVLLTDAIDTEGRTVAGLLAGETVVHALAIDDRASPMDARVLVSPTTALAYTGQPAALRVRIVQHAMEGRRARFELRQDGELIHERVVRFARESSQTFDVAITPRLAPGVSGATLAYEARLSPVEGEADAENNEAIALLRVSAEPIRVLVLEGQPHWDSRFFVRAMRGDGQVEVTSASTLDDRFRSGTRAPNIRVTRSGLLEGADEPVTLPKSVDELARYDVIVVGRAVEQFFPGRDAEMLRDVVVQRGRSILFLRGDPVVSTEPEARRTGRVLEELFAGPVERELGPGELRRAGAGVVLLNRSPGSYRDALLPPGASVEERSAYGRLWSGIVRTLATSADLPPGADLVIHATPMVVAPGKPVKIAVRVRSSRVPMPGSLSILSPSERESTMTMAPDPGSPLRAVASFVPSEEGVYLVTDSDGHEARFAVVENRVEFLDLAPRTDATGALARRTGGTVFTAADGPDPLLAVIERARAAERADAETSPAWDRWWLALLLGCTLLSEWAIRRRASR